MDVGVDARGDATIIWSTRSTESNAGIPIEGVGVYARRLSRDGTLGPRIEVTPGGGGAIRSRVEVTPSGRAIVAWTVEDSYAIHVATISRRGGLGRVIDVTDAEAAFSTDLTVDASGNLVVAWCPGRLDTVFIRRVGADGSLGPIRVIATSTNAEVYEPSLALGAARSATVTWVFAEYSDYGFTYAVVESRRIDAYGKLSPRTNVSSPIADAPTFQSTIDRAGNQTVSWARRIGPPPQIGGWALQARRIGRDGFLGAIETFASGGCLGGGCDFAAPRLFSDANGVVTAVWREEPPDTAGAIKLSRFTP